MNNLHDWKRACKVALRTWWSHEEDIPESHYDITSLLLSSLTNAVLGDLERAHPEFMIMNPPAVWKAICGLYDESSATDKKRAILNIVHFDFPEANMHENESRFLRLVANLRTAFHEEKYIYIETFCDIMLQNNIHLL